MSKRTPPKTWAWDIEALEWDRPRCVVAVSSTGDVERFAGPGCLAAMVDVAERVGGTWVAHAGGIYDTLLYSQERGRPWSELIMSGSAVLAAHEGRRLVLRDSFRWWLSSLRKVGVYLDAVEQRRPDPRHPVGHWHKQEVDRQRIGSLTDAEVLSYCESDCGILLEGIGQARAYLQERGARPAWTAGASALGLLQALEPVTWRALKRHALPTSTAIPAGACVRGARVEVWARGEVPRVHVYDWSSAYPASYATESIGIGAVRLEAGARDRPGSVWRCRWFWPWRDRIPPATDAATGAGAGWCEAWLCEEERQCFSEEEIHLEMLEGWAPACLFPVGQIFAPELYREKNAGSFFGKVYLNSLGAAPAA